MFFGYRIKKITFFIIWFIIGYYLMTNYIMGWVNSAVPQIADNNIYQILLPIAGGVLLAMLGFSIEKVCVAGATLGLTMMVTTQFFGHETTTLIIGLVVGVILAGVATAMMKPACIVVTSVMGAHLLSKTLIYVLKMNGIDINPYYLLMLIPLSIAGALVQFSTNKHSD